MGAGQYVFVLGFGPIHFEISQGKRILFSLGEPVSDITKNHPKMYLQSFLE
jgi:hypothetical protein